MFHYFREESIRNIAKQYGWDLITPQNMADKFMKFIETMDMSYSYKPVLLKAIYEYMDTSGRVALPDVVDYFIDFYEDRKLTREDWLHIVNVCNKSLEKYYLRLKK